MKNQAQLTIRLTPGALRPHWGRGGVNVLRGGPETLLEWLEMQLGLPVVDFHKADRITEYAAALHAGAESAIADSMKSDCGINMDSFSIGGRDRKVRLISGRGRCINKAIEVSLCAGGEWYLTRRNECWPDNEQEI